MTRLRPVWFAVGLTALATTAASAPDSTIPTYSATYHVEYKGKDVGTSQFTVRYIAERDVYEFTSRTQAQGFLKLARPNPVVDRSEFRVENGHIRPLEFWYEDGSRKGEDNLHIVFDWERRVAVVSGDGGRREVALQEGSLDRGSMQVALMRDLALSGKPGEYFLATDNNPKAYDYKDSGDATTPTGLGTLATHAFTQQRENSSRATWLWMAPQMRFLPARIEQRKDGEVTSAFRLDSVQGLTGN